MLAIDDAGRRLSRYFVSQLAVNAAFGLVIGLGLSVIGVPSPAVWGVLSGILRFVSVIALSYLELTGSPAHLRYLIARLRQRAPGVSIVIGLWPAGESALSDPAIQKVVGADRCVGSLREAVEATRAALSISSRASA